MGTFVRTNRNNHLKTIYELKNKENVHQVNLHNILIQIHNNVR